MVLVVAYPRISCLVLFSIGILICSFVVYTESVQDGAVQPVTTTVNMATNPITSKSKNPVTTPKTPKKKGQSAKPTTTSKLPPNPTPVPKKVDIIGTTIDVKISQKHSKSQPSPTPALIRQADLKNTDELNAMIGDNGTTLPSESGELVLKSSTFDVTFGAENKPSATISPQITPEVNHKSSADVTSDTNSSSSPNVTFTPKPNFSANVSSTTKPSSSANVNTTSKPSSSANVTSTTESSSSVNTTSTTKPNSSDNVSSTTKPSSSANVNTTTEANSSANVSSTTEPSSSANVSSTTKPSFSATVNTTTEANSSANVGSTTKPSSSATVNTTTEPNSSANVSSTTQPSSSVNTTSTTKPNSFADVTPAPKLNSSDNVSSTTEPNSSANVSSTTEPSSSVNTTSTTKPNSSANVTPTTKPNSSAYVNSTSNPNSSANDSSTTKLSSSANATSTTKPNSSPYVSSTSKPNASANITSTAKPNYSANVTSTSKPNFSAKITSGNGTNSSNNTASTRNDKSRSSNSSKEDANVEIHTTVAPHTGNTSLTERNVTENIDTEVTSSKQSPKSLPTCPDNFTKLSPEDLEISQLEPTNMTITWNFNQSVLAEYNSTIEVEKFTISYSCDDGTRPASSMNSSYGKVTITGLTVNTKYNICVKAVTNCGDSVSTCRIVTTKRGILRQPNNVSVSDVGPHSFQVSWIPVEDELESTQYVLCVNRTDDSCLIAPVVTKTNETTIENLSPYTFYNVSFRANNSDWFSDWIEFNLRTKSAVPDTPYNLRAENVTSNSFVARWSPPNEYPGPTYYIIRLIRQIDGFARFNQSATFISLSHLDSYTEYCFTVTAFTEAGSSNPSSDLCSTTAPSTPLKVKGVGGNCTSTKCTFYWHKPKKMTGKFKHFKTWIHQGSHEVNSSQTVVNSITFPNLSPNTNYTFKVTSTVEGIEEEGKEATFSIVTHANPESPMTGVIASLITLTVMGLIFGMVVLVLKWKDKLPGLGHLRRYYYHREGETQTSETSMAIPFRTTAKPVQLGEFEEHLRTMTADSGLKFSQEFEELNMISPACPTIIAQLPENRPKNRWINILPFDHSRVKLLPIADDVSSDYINASYIPGHHSQREYIASQGPLPSTKDDFWRMIWEQSCSTIVTVTQLVERGKVKCEPYWPTDSEQHDFGDLLVSLTSEDVRNSYTVRGFSIQLKKSSVSRPASSEDISDQTELISQNFVLDQGSRQMEIKQLHFTTWPDFGCPENTSTLIDFVRAVQSAATQSNLMGPTMVHCSAGVGRTGTFIAVDIIMHHIQEHDYVDVYGIVRAMRHYRSNMVQTEDQYVFIHECACDLIREAMPKKEIKC